MFRPRAVTSLLPACLVLLGTMACRPGANVPFSPYSALQASTPPITPMAVEVLVGDRGALSRCNPKVLGWVTAGDGVSLEDARVAAADHGGTHVTARGSHDEVRGNRYYVGTVTTTDYVVLRISEDCWSELPEPLRPAQLPVQPGK